jgi:hypothetical protein
MKRTTNGIGSIAKNGFFSALLEEVRKNGFARRTLKAGGKITPTQLHVWCVEHGFAYKGDMILKDHRPQTF